MATCKGPECDLEAVAKGLCPGHYAQDRRGRPLTALRPELAARRPGHQKRLVSLRLQPPIADGVEADRAGAERLLTGWVKRQKPKR